MLTAEADHAADLYEGVARWLEAQAERGGEGADTAFFTHLTLGKHQTALRVTRTIVSGRLLAAPSSIRSREQPTG